MVQTATNTSAKRTFTVNIKDQIIDGGTYRMDWKNGGMIRCTDRPELPKGTKIVSYGYAGCMDIWAMTGRTPSECVKVSPNSDAYFSHPYHNIDRYARPVSEVFGIGFYYDLDAPRFSDEEIGAAILRAEEWIAQKEAEEKAAEEAHRIALEETRAKYAGVYEEKSGGMCTDAAHVAKNIRKDLAAAFPGQKFSVRKNGYSAVRISWTDGPTESEVEEVVGKHRRSRSRDAYNDDIWDYDDTAFTELFGGVDYIWMDRELSEEVTGGLQAEIEAICPDTKGEGFHFRRAEEHEGGMALYTAYHDIRELNWLNSQSIARFILNGRSFYKAPEKPARKAEAKEPAAGTRAEGVEIIDYSEKAIAVTGDTKPHADTLRELGGRFNPRLSCGAGWIFSKKKEAAVREALGL